MKNIIIVKDDQFNPPTGALEERFGKLSKQIEVLFEGAMVLGSKQMLKWDLASNMMRPKSDFTKVKMKLLPRSFHAFMSQDSENHWRILR